jgi:hypothetical protein
MDGIGVAAQGITESSHVRTPLQLAPSSADPDGLKSGNARVAAPS